VRLACVRPAASVQSEPWFDLHVLGLPPAFNLSHDQTLQFKSLMLKELNFVMNYVFTLETWYSFFVLRR
ncbi:hypothetical protein, partial [Escherichia coli]|uniref:hypothetical protein n=1 Tax=Escherichia coli TaxID=562 RepID=UPI00237F0499